LTDCVHIVEMIKWSTQHYRQDPQTRDKQCSTFVQSAGTNTVIACSRLLLAAKIVFLLDFFGNYLSICFEFLSEIVHIYYMFVVV